MEIRNRSRSGGRRIARSAFVLVLAAFSAREGNAQVAADYAVQASATVQASPPTITLSWGAFSGATGYTVYRKSYAASTWGAAIATLPGSATGYADNSVVAATRYEYQIQRTATAFAYGYVASGIDVPLVDNRGKVVLVVDQTYAPNLATELTGLEWDLAGDGWIVLRHDVARNATVPSVKALIQADYGADPANVKAVFLFGHVPVPYSGDIAPDGHSNHVGAWPADMYYADMDGVWTDVNELTPGATGRQSNHPGDGKFDQSYAPSPLELQVGRVDLQDMPAFSSKAEVDLLRQYLNKDHNFRHKIVTAQPRGLIDDNFGAFGGEAFASTGWRAFSGFFGASNVFALDWFTTLATQSYLWAYGCGGGNFTGASGVGSTSNFASTDTQVVFTMLFGSYFGDWDTQNNFLRAPLATTTYGLTCAWAGRPAWYFHHMSMGETIGYSALVTQNNIGLYWNSWSRSVHIALLGDPTLRLHPVAPIAGLTATPSGGPVRLDWTASPDAGLGYNVYRSASPNGPFTRLNGSFVAGTTFLDTGAPAGTSIYMVRAVRLEVSASGSYENASQGIAVTFAPVVPTLTGINPTSGIATGGTDISITGTNFLSLPSVAIGGVTAAPVSFLDSSHIHAPAPALSAGKLNDLVVTNPDSTTATLPKAWFADFLDVAGPNAFHPFVEKLIRDGVTIGCGAGNYCPNVAVTRAQMAVFLLRSKDGPSYLPPACVSPPFSDVPCSSPFARWIQELANRQITAGCGGGAYCPSSPVTRAEMAVLLLLTQDGSGYVPPPATGVFADVPASSPYAKWIEELARRGIAAGCGGGNFCPANPVTRGQMAVFLVTTFGLP